MRQFNFRFVAVVAIGAAIALSACSSSSKTSSDTVPADASTTTAAPTTTAAADTSTTAAAGSATATIKTAQTSLGATVVDSSGMTLYQFSNDTTPGQSACGTGCDKIWPPAIATGAATGGAGITGTVATITRSDGKKQVTLAGHPLYTFSGDKAAGDVNGQGVGDIWYATAGDGAKLGDAS